LLEEDDVRIELWRNTIQLFHQYERPRFVGPFKAAGFNEYRVEPLVLLSKTGRDLNPDIIASGKNDWLVLELSFNKKSKKSILDLYKQIDSRDLGQYGLPVHDNEPEIVVSRFDDFIPDGPYCKTTVKDTLKVKDEIYINNSFSRDELKIASGIDLGKLPEIPITLLSEMKPQEIRRGLIELVMQIFDPDSDGKTPVELVEDGLERLSDKISITAKSELIKNVTNEMELLIGKFLPEYLIIDEETSKYKATEKAKQHHRTRMHIATKLREWGGIGPQKTLNNDFKNKNIISAHLSLVFPHRLQLLQHGRGRHRVHIHPQLLCAQAQGQARQLGDVHHQKIDILPELLLHGVLVGVQHQMTQRTYRHDRIGARFPGGFDIGEYQ
jgi:hypothetical protein